MRADLDNPSAVELTGDVIDYRRRGPGLPEVQPAMASG